jgi:hypothetical protein
VALNIPGVTLEAGLNVTVIANGLVADGTLAPFFAVDADGIFSRGDSNRDRSFNISDPVATLIFLFIGDDVESFCPDAADSDDDGHVLLPDAVLSLNYLFLGGQPPSAPFPAQGIDPTVDGLGCGVKVGL